MSEGQSPAAGLLARCWPNRRAIHGDESTHTDMPGTRSRRQWLRPWVRRVESVWADESAEDAATSRSAAPVCVRVTFNNPDAIDLPLAFAPVEARGRRRQDVIRRAFNEEESRPWLHREVSFSLEPAPPSIQNGAESASAAALDSTSQSSTSSMSPSSAPPSIITQVDFINFLIPCMREIVGCPFYFGKIDRYEAESLLEGRPEGAFLLRDSAQDEHVFSVSFRRYSRSLHARIEEARHRFSFDSHDPGVHSCVSVCGLLNHYKDPNSCMFFEPMLLHPVFRKTCFSLQELCRAAICDRMTEAASTASMSFATPYEAVSALPLPKTLKDFLREYSYRHKIGSRQIEQRNRQV